MEIQDGKLNIISSLMSYLFVFLVEDCNSYWSVFTQVQRQKQTWRISDSCQNVVTSMSICQFFCFCYVTVLYFFREHAANMQNILKWIYYILHIL